MDLIIETQNLTPASIAALLVIREEPELICDRCLDPDQIVVTLMEIAEIDETLALCGSCVSELPRGHHVA